MDTNSQPEPDRQGDGNVVQLFPKGQLEDYSDWFAANEGRPEALTDALAEWMELQSEWLADHLAEASRYKYGLVADDRCSDDGEFLENIAELNDGLVRIAAWLRGVRS